MLAPPTITIETITPDAAAELLGLNLTNRLLRNHKVIAYAEDMLHGRWQLTGEPIIVNGTTLLNGQHRLHACVRAGVPFTTAVFRGADSDIYRVIDSGLPRLPADVLRHDGHPNPNLVAATGRLVLGYRTGTLTDTNRLAITASRLALQEEAADHRELYHSATCLGSNARKDGFNPSAVAAFSALVRTRNAWARHETRTQIKSWFTGQPFPRLEEKPVPHDTTKGCTQP